MALTELTSVLESFRAPTDDLTGKTVVVCEDEGLTVLQFGAALSRAGLEIVGTAVNGEEAVRVVLEEKPDFVLMDINMPVIDGIEAIRRILERLEPRILVVTAYSDDVHLDEAMAAGAAGYLVKPITSDDLVEAIRTINAG